MASRKPPPTLKREAYMQVANQRGILRLLLTLVILLTASPSVVAQNNLVPYYGKNQVRYDNFEWHIYTTDHFEIYYYPAIKEHLERVTGYAESAYQQISSELKHDLGFKVPLILFKTSSEFQQQNVIPGAAQEGVGAFAEPSRKRIVMPLDNPPDLLYRLILHELTHQFDYDIIPTSLFGDTTPLWIHEGLADYMTGVWRPIDLMMVRDLAIADTIPEMSRLEGYGGLSNVRLIYNLGHTVFEFIEFNWNKAAVREYLFSLRKSIVGEGISPYQDAFNLSAEEFDQQFEKYLRERFKPFRDKERPSDYGRNLAPDPRETSFSGALSVESSPSGELLAIVTGNNSDREIDILVVSSNDGSVVTHLTDGFDKDHGFEFVVQPGMRFITVPWLSWSPTGDQLAYFVRDGKSRTLIIQNVLTRKIVQRIKIDTVDDPESPDFSPNGRKIAFAGLRNAVGDIFVVDLETSEVTNVTNDTFADSGPTWSPDGDSLIYVARISGNEKLRRLDIAAGQKTQITFGTHDDAPAQFLDAETIVFSSTATDPINPPPADVGQNGQIYNIWTLNLETGALQQHTDTLGGNTSPVVLATEGQEKIAFISYYKGDYELHVLNRLELILTTTTENFGSPGPIIDFQAPLSHTFIGDNNRRKGTFEKMFLDGRPPISVGVTTGGDVFGGTQITFADVLGDQQFSFYAASVAQYRTLSFSYANLSKRFQYALQGYSQTEFFFGLQDGVFIDPSLSLFLNRDNALATRTVQGGTAFGIWPFDQYRRIELFGGLLHYREQYNNDFFETQANQFQQSTFGRQLFRNGMSVPLGINFIQETTIFREFGPLAGNTMRLTYEVAPKIGNTLSRQTAEADVRHYFRLRGSGLLALRGHGFKSWGAAPDFNFFGGNSEMRGNDYLEFIGQNTFYLNAELRFPLIEAMLTPLGVLGGIRGVLFANMGGASFAGQPFKTWTSETEFYTPTIGYQANLQTQTLDPIQGPLTAVEGFRLVDARASYGLGLETFVLGFPVHFDWAWRTLFNKQWEDVLFATEAFQAGVASGSAWFRDPRFALWIGYDF